MNAETILPAISLHGSTALFLYEENRTACEAVFDAKKALAKIEPNPRDYATLAGYDAALLYHKDRLKLLSTVINQLDEIAAHLSPLIP